MVKTTIGVPDRKRDLGELAGEVLEVDPAGRIKPAEARRLMLEYGIEVSTEYNFVAAGEIRLTDGTVLQIP